MDAEWATQHSSLLSPLATPEAPELMFCWRADLVHVFSRTSLLYFLRQLAGGEGLPLCFLFAFSCYFKVNLTQWPPGPSLRIRLAHAAGVLIQSKVLAHSLPRNIPRGIDPLIPVFVASPQFSTPSSRRTQVILLGNSWLMPSNSNPDSMQEEGSERSRAISCLGETGAI